MLKVGLAYNLLTIRVTLLGFLSVLGLLSFYVKSQTSVVHTITLLFN